VVPVFQCLSTCLMYRRSTEVLLAVVLFGLAASTALILSAPIVISIKFLLIISVHYNTWRSWELGPPYNAVRGNFSPVVLKRNLLQAWSIEQISFDPGSGLSELNNEREHFVWMWEENLSVFKQEGFVATLQKSPAIAYSSVSLPTKIASDRWRSNLP